MSDWQKAYAKDDIYCHLDSICEHACEICIHRSEYKDPDDLEKNCCSICVIFEKAEELKEEIDERL